MNRSDKRDPAVEEVWRVYLTTGMPPERIHLPWYESPRMRSLARHLPSDPRCKVCRYPFGGLGGKLVRSFLRVQPSRMNPHLCNVCERFANENPGGAELEVSLLFADIRGSTPLAATMDAYEFSQIIDRFYRATTDIIYQYGGMVEKLVGDEVAAFFPPAFAENNNFARAAFNAAQAILAATGHGQIGAPWVPVGVGIHTGKAYVGAVGEPGKNIDIAMLGDNVNIAARLASQAQAGEIVVSEETVRRSGLETEGLEFRHLTLKGKEAPFASWIYQASVT